MNIKQKEIEMWEAAKNIDLQGEFHITSTWKKFDGDWKLIFNMDSRRSKG